MSTKQPDNYYFIGCGGIGMAALERYFLSKGKRVAGYDRTPTRLTSELADEGVEIFYKDDPQFIPMDMRSPENTQVVYTPAVSDEHRGLQWFRDNGFTPVKRARVLGDVTRDSLALCFSGTHGKTTTSSMAAWIMHNSSTGCNAFLGGVLRNTDSNLILSEDSPYSVVEADEYDRSFHHLTPYVAVVTATDPDHLDIYGTEEAYLESFSKFTSLIRPHGYLLMHEGLKFKPDVNPEVKIYTYGRMTGDFHASNISHADGVLSFDIVFPDGTVMENVRLGAPADINVENAIAAVGAVWLTGRLEKDSARQALATFLGARRRFEVWLNTPQHAVVDDYAHHPDELRASIQSLRLLYPGRELTVAFQPHLYSRTRDFAAEFAEALSEADNVLLLDIYPARELPIEGVSSALIYDRLTCPHKQRVSKEQLAGVLLEQGFDVLLTAGAGDIDTKIPDIMNSIEPQEAECSEC